MSTHRSAMGKQVNMDTLRLANETQIAIGNMRTNARGDQLGTGGKIIKTRAEIMQEYYDLNVPVADDTPLQRNSSVNAAMPSIFEQPPQIVQESEKMLDDLDGGVEQSYTKPRGSLADTVAQKTEVNQTLLQPQSKRNGIQRI